MSQVIDAIFRDVCLDERVKDGIFKLDETEHMDALRDHLVKGGLTLEDAKAITNRMVEGKYPERQAYRKEDGILVTWPSVKHKAKAMQENPGKYSDQNPHPATVKKEEPPEELPLDKEPPPEDKSKENVPKEPPPQSVFQGGQELAIEPIRGPEKPEPIPQPPTTPVTLPTTPRQKNAEKAVVQQMIQGDEILSSQPHPSISELYNLASKKGLKEAAEFLKQYIVT